MADRKTAGQRFELQAVKDAVERMRPELIAASEAAHNYVASQNETEEDEDFDKTLAIGFLARNLDCLCGPHLWLLDEIGQALADLERAEEKKSQGPSALPTKG